MKIQLKKDIELLEKKKERLEKAIESAKDYLAMLEENKKIVEKRIEITKEIIEDV